MNSAIPKRSSGDAAATPKAEPSLLSSLPPPPAPVPTPQQKKVQEPSQQSQQQRPPPSTRNSSETISLPQVASSLSNYQPSPKKAALTDIEKRMMKKLDDLADIVSSNVTDDIESNNILSVDPREFMQRESRQGGSIDLFGSFITHSENRYDFFDTDPVTNTINVTPLPNSRIPIFPEDFPPSTTEWPLRWWGIHQPSEELLQLHDEKARSLGYPVSKRKGTSSPASKVQSTAEKSSRGNESRDSKSSSRRGSDRDRGSDSRRRKRSGDSSGKERSRKRHDDRRHRRS